ASGRRRARRIWIRWGLWIPTATSARVGAAPEADLVAEITLVVEGHGRAAAGADRAPPAALDAGAVGRPLVGEHHPLIGIADEIKDPLPGAAGLQGAGGQALVDRVER